jgi:hypothetical protein
MNILTKRFQKPLAVVVTLVICIGTAAGAYIWISNQITRDITVTDTPIVLQDEYMSPTYLDEYITWIVNYTINIMDESDGYIWVDIWAPSAITTSEANIVDVQIKPEFGMTNYGSLVSGYPQNLASNEIVFVYESTYGGPIDFSDYGSSSAGDITFILNFTIASSFILNMQLTSSL